MQYKQGDMVYGVSYDGSITYGSIEAVIPIDMEGLLYTIDGKTFDSDCVSNDINKALIFANRKIREQVSTLDYKTSTFPFSKSLIDIDDKVRELEFFTKKIDSYAFETRICVFGFLLLVIPFLVYLIFTF